jgi:hypothetical protein
MEDNVVLSENKPTSHVVFNRPTGNTHEKNWQGQVRENVRWETGEEDILLAMYIWF